MTAQSTWKKSTASMLVACVRRNCRHVMSVCRPRPVGSTLELPKRPAFTCRGTAWKLPGTPGLIRRGWEPGGRSPTGQTSEQEDKKWPLTEELTSI